MLYYWVISNQNISMMTSSNGNIFRVTGHLCGEWWIPCTKGQWRGALMFSLICARINGWVNNGEAGYLRRHRAHYDVIVMSVESTWYHYSNPAVNHFPDKHCITWSARLQRGSNIILCCHYTCCTCCIHMYNKRISWKKNKIHNPLCQTYSPTVV